MKFSTVIVIIGYDSMILSIGGDSSPLKVSLFAWFEPTTVGIFIYAFNDYFTVVFNIYIIYRLRFYVCVRYVKYSFVITTVDNQKYVVK